MLKIRIMTAGKAGIAAILRDIGLDDADVKIGHTTLTIGEEVAKIKGQAIFDALTKKGYSAFAPAGEGGSMVRTTTLVPEAKELFFLLPISGG